jgi:hypothetical protein
MSDSATEVRPLKTTHSTCPNPIIPPEEPVDNAKTRQKVTQAAKTRLRERAIAALLSTSTLDSAAKACGLGKRTLQRWLKEPEFAKEFRAAKTDLLHTATAKLTVNSTKAAETLKVIFGDPKAPSSARVAAAVNTLCLALDAYHLEDLEERLRRLEEQSNAL